MPKNEEFNFDQFAGSFLDDVNQEIGKSVGTSLNIIEFTKQELDLGIELFPQQKLILKLFYGLKLTTTEQSIVDFWSFEKKVTYQVDYEHQALALGLGRRSGKCNNILSATQTKEYGLTYQYELLNLNDMSIARSSLINTGDSSIEKQVSLARQLNLENDTWYDIDENVSVSIEGKNKTDTANKFYSKGVSNTKLITTHCGYTIEGTEEHRIKFINKEGNIQWGYLSDLKEGDFACIHRNTNLWPEHELYIQMYYVQTYNAKDLNVPETLNSNWAYLMGLLVGNGSWTVKGGLECTLHTQDLDNYINAYLDCGLTDYKQHVKNIDLPLCSKIQYFSTCTRNFLDKLGWSLISKPDTKLTPWSIRRSPKHIVANYLAGLFDADGSVEKQGQQISFSTASKQLSIETQLLLLNFGIVCFRKEKIVNNKPYYLLFIRGRKSTELFVKEIGFRLERKQNLVISNLQKTVKEGGNTEAIPNQKLWLQKVRDLLSSNTGFNQTTYNEFNLKQISLKQQFRNIVGNCAKLNCDEQLSSYKLYILIPFLEKHITDLEILNHFKYLQDCNYFYDPIISIDDSKAFCVDLSVPNSNEYVCQGFTNHNSLLASIIIAYEFYKLCILKSPQEHYEISKSSWIGILVIATTATQSKDTIFGSVIGAFESCPFFKRLEAKGDLFIGTEYITLKSKLLTIKSGNSKAAGQVGGNLICLVMDEFALFTDNDEQSNAMHLWSALGISLSPFGYHGKRLALSSAICDGDAIEQLINVGKNDDTLMTLEACSWEINPKAHPDINPIVSSEYKLNTKTAALHYENKRTGSEESFLTYEEIIQAHIGISVINAVNSQIEVVSEYDPTVVNLLTAVQILHLEPAAPGIKTFLHLDASVKKDNYALAFGHIYFNTFTKSNSLVIDGYIVWEPTVDAPVYFENVFNIIIEIHKKRPIYMLSADQYAGSAETMQKIKNYGIKTKIINFGNNQQVIMYNVLNNYLHERKITLPQTGIWKDLLLRELKNVLLIKNGAVIKVDHPKGNYLTKSTDAEGNETVIVDAHSKDIADCISSIAWNTVTEKLITATNQNIQISTGQVKTSHTTNTVADGMGHAPPAPLSLRDRYKSNHNLIRNIKNNNLFK